MHPDLRVENLDKLPLAHRLLAKSLIVGPNAPSKATLKKLSDAMKQTNVMNHDGVPEINGFLPVFYALLDPSRIPSPAALEIQTADAELYGIIWGGILSVQGCVAGIPPPSVFPDVWPRLSAWADFLLTYTTFLSSVSNLNYGPMDPFWVISMEFYGRMAKLAPNRSLILSAPKSRIFASRAWKCFLQSTDWFDRNVALSMIHGIMTEGDAYVGLDDVLEGISGTLSDLADLIMRQCRLLAPLDDSALPPPGSSRIPSLMILSITLNIVDCVDQIHTTPAWTEGSRYPLCRALVPLGFVDVLISAARILSNPDPAFVFHRPGMMARCLQILEAIFTQDRKIASIEHALRQGLLKALLSISSLPEEQLSAEDILAVQRLVINMIPSTVYYDHLVALQKAVIETPQSAIANIPSKELRHIWSAFLLAFHVRFNARVSFTSDATVSRNICGNATCRLILDKINLKCCAGCRGVTYCSKQCQIIDWRIHRDRCVQERTSLTTSRLLYTRKEYSFLQFLLHQSYLNERTQIALDHVHGWANEPNMRFCTEFNYNFFPAAAKTVEAPENLPPKLFRGSGLMDTILLRLPDASKGQREWIFRIARENPAVPEKLKEIAMQYHSLNPAEVLKRVGRVMREEGETVITLDG